MTSRLWRNVNYRLRVPLSVTGSGFVCQSVTGSGFVSQPGPSGIGAWVSLREYLAIAGGAEGVSASAIAQRASKAIRNGTFGLPTRRTLSKYGQWCYEVWISEPESLRKIAMRRGIREFSQQNRPVSVLLRMPPHARESLDAMLNNNELRREFDHFISQLPLTEFQAAGFDTVGAEPGKEYRRRVRLSTDSWSQIHAIAGAYHISASVAVVSLCVMYCARKRRVLPGVLRAA